jgi:hypothetical protein
VRIVRAFGPRIDADLDAARPRILSPLFSGAQTVRLARRGGAAPRVHTTQAEPPPHAVASLVEDLPQPTAKKACSAANYLQRRKRAVVSVYDARVESLVAQVGRGVAGHRRGVQQGGITKVLDQFHLSGLFSNCFPIKQHISTTRVDK